MGAPLTESTGRRMLTQGDKSNLLARMRGLVRSVDGTSETGSARAAPAFETLEEFRTLTKHRNVARDYQVADPFFREQAGRAGPTTVIDGREVLNFSSYGYLGLNHVPSVATAAKAAIDRYGPSVSASRLVAGERQILRDLSASSLGLRHRRCSRVRQWSRHQCRRDIDPDASAGSCAL